MERGIYTDHDNNVVYFGNRKPSDPTGLTWVEIEDELNNLRELGFFVWKWDGSDVVANPALATAQQEHQDEHQDEQDREDAYRQEQETSGLMGITVDQVKTWIDSQIDPAADLDQLKAACKKVFKKIAVFLV